MHRGSVSVQSANGVNTFAFSTAASLADSVTLSVRSNAAKLPGTGVGNGAANANTPPAPASYSSLVKGKSA
jgi:two-component system heavy metal sensor histidine kinase CusS